MQNISLIRVHQVTISVPMRFQPGSLRRKLVREYEEGRKRTLEKKTRSVRFLSSAKAHSNDLSSWRSGVESPRALSTSLLTTVVP